MKMKNSQKGTDIRRVLYIKYVRREKSFIQELHRHAVFGHELVYVDYGQVDVTMNQDTITLKTGECVLIRGGTEHTFTGKRTMPFSYLNAMFRGTIEGALYGKVLPVNQFVRKCLEQLKVDSETESCVFLKDELILCHFTELILQILRYSMMKMYNTDPREINLPNSKPYLPSNTLRHHSMLVQKALEIIRDNFCRPPSMDKVAGALNISNSHLRALLRKETGNNFMALLHKARIEAAKHYLQEGTASLSEISTAVGYDSPAFFFTIFKRQTGITPREYSASLGEASGYACRPPMKHCVNRWHIPQQEME